MSSEPMTNSGSEVTASELTEMAWSSGRPARSAARTPKKSESGTMIRAVIAARTNEFRSGPLMSSQIEISPPCA
jgi:hypothetical protein